MKMKTTIMLASIMAGSAGVYYIMKKYNPKMTNKLKKDVNKAIDDMENEIENMTK